MVVTKSSCAARQSLWERDVARAIVLAMDAVAIVIGFAMFAILLWMIEGIDRV
jgi:multisubunit Na+/H+ antiporter MnhC subunit